MRYIGNKNKLLNEIEELLKQKNLCKRGLVFCDIFSGTATVANNFNGYYKIIANDFLDYSYTLSSGLLKTKNNMFEKLGFDPFDYFNSYDTKDYVQGFCYNHFSPNANRQYFSDENAKFIDYIRDSIDIWFNNRQIDEIEKNYLIACLIESVSKVSNVAGVYSAYLKIWDPRAVKKMVLSPIAVKETQYFNDVFCKDANLLINEISGDILYIDPPYTPTQYNSQYHVLETIARNDNPQTHGIGAHRENDRLSKWCKKGYVEFEFEKLIANAKFKHIIFSYSDKGIMSTNFIEAVLKRYAKDGTYTFKKINFVKYKNTRAVNREKLLETENLKHFEYLFYIEKKSNINYNSPLNYIGGKYDSLQLIKNNLPCEINTCFDLFGGGGTVGININTNNLIYNDINNYVKDLLEYLSKNEPFALYQSIQKHIKKYNLYKGNKEGYRVLRDEYNLTKNSLLLYLLICYGFEHQIRFNSKHEFNNPCGNSGFNDEMYEKMINYHLRCKALNISFYSTSYEKFFEQIREGDFVYLDPPYLNNLGVYNDGKRGFNGWDLCQEKALYKFMEDLNSKNIKFMLSNYTEHTNSENSSLIEWAKDKGFRVIYDDKLIKRNRQNRRELIIINY